MSITACKIVCGHEVLHNSLLLTSIEALLFAKHRSAHAIPPGWDAPFCTTLGVASQLLSQELCRSSDGPPLSGSLQAKIYKLLCASDDAKNLAWRKFLGDRMCNLWSDQFEEPSVLSDAHFQDVCRVLMTLGLGPRLCVIEALINSWATSCRMGESVDLPFSFCGEDIEDDFDHYLECDSFWTLLVTSAGLKSLGCSSLLLPPSHRVGILHPTILGWGHALKLEHIVLVKSARASGDLSPIHELTLSLAGLHYSDLNVQADVQGAQCGFQIETQHVGYPYKCDDKVSLTTTIYEWSDESPGFRIHRKVARIKQTSRRALLCRVPFVLLLPLEPKKSPQWSSRVVPVGPSPYNFHRKLARIKQDSRRALLYRVPFVLFPLLEPKRTSSCQYL